MLTKNDLKSISGLLKPIKDDISTLKTDVSSLKTDMSAVKLDIAADKAHNFRIENRIIDLKQTFETNLLKGKSELFTKIDKVMKRLEKTDIENTFLKNKAHKHTN